MARPNFRVIRAAENLAALNEYLAGQERAYGEYGCSAVVPIKPAWQSDPDTYLILATSPSTGEVVGGVRIHVRLRAGRLPLEDLFETLDPRVVAQIETHGSLGLVSEFSGLWVHREFRGARTGGMLVTAGVALSIALNVSAAITFSSPHAVSMFEKAGFLIERAVGDNGGFEYPDARYFSKFMWNRSLGVEAMTHENAQLTDSLAEEMQSFLQEPARIAQQGRTAA